MRSARKADRVAEDLLARIVSGDLPAGSLLPREADLADRYRVNRSVVREANKLLEVHRLVRPTRRKGTVVLDPQRSVTPAVVRAMLVPAGKLDPRVLSDLLEVRAELDVMMSRLAAARRTPEDLRALREIVARIELADPGSDASLDAIVDLSLALARAANNRVLAMLVSWHAEIAEALRPLLREVQAPAAARRVHRALVDAIEEQNDVGAAEMVAAYHAWAIPRLVEAAGTGRAPARSKSKEHAHATGSRSRSKAR